MSSNQAFVDQWGHLWDDMGDVDPATAKRCFDIHSLDGEVIYRAEVPEQQGAPDEE